MNNNLGRVQVKQASLLLSEATSKKQHTNLRSKASKKKHAKKLEAQGQGTRRMRRKGLCLGKN